MLPPRCAAHHLLLNPLTPPEQVSKTVLRRCMRVLPALRDKLIGAFAAFVVRIQEDHAQVIKESLDLLLRFVFVLPCVGVLPPFQHVPINCVLLCTCFQCCACPQCFHCYRRAALQPAACLDWPGSFRVATACCG